MFSPLADMEELDEEKKEMAIDKFVTEYASKLAKGCAAARAEKVLPTSEIVQNEDDEDDDPMSAGDAWSDWLALSGG